MEKLAEWPFFFGEQGRRTFGVLHQPAAGCVWKNASWVLCAALGQERGNAQRFMVEWARALSRQGYWVLRFDYRGYGDSDGAEEEYSIEDHVADIDAALAEVERRTGVPCWGLCGLRLGATMAAVAAAQRHRHLHLILWEPLVSGQAYLDALLRLVMVKEMSDKGAAPRTRDTLRQCLAQGEVLVADGHAVTHRLSQSLAAVDLLELKRPEGAVFVAQFSDKPERKLRNELAALRDACARNGDVEVHRVCMPRPWALDRDLPTKPAPLFAATLDWIRSRGEEAKSAPGSHAAETGPPVEPWQHPEERTNATRVPAPDGSSCRDCVERVVELDVDGTVVRGILHMPDGYAADRPAILMPPPGTDSRTGYNRQYVRLARELAWHGWASLRLDPRGVGDSDGDWGHAQRPQHLLAVQDGLYVPDMVATTDFLVDEVGPRQVILSGICGGAITAVLQAAQDPRIAGIVAMEFQLRYMPQPGTQTAVPLAAYTRKMASVHAWRRFLTLKSSYRSLTRAVLSQMVVRLRRLGPVSERQWLRDELGPRANMALIEALWHCLARDLPILFIYGDTEDQKCFAATKKVLMRGYDTAPVTEHVIAHADHAFSLPQHTRELFSTIVDWLAAPNQPWTAIH